MVLSLELRVVLWRSGYAELSVSPGSKVMGKFELAQLQGGEELRVC